SSARWARVCLLHQLGATGAVADRRRRLWPPGQTAQRAVAPASVLRGLENEQRELVRRSPEDVLSALSGRRTVESAARLSLTTMNQGKARVEPRAPSSADPRPVQPSL